MIKVIRRAFVAIAGGLIVLLALAGFALPVIPGTALLIGGLLLWSTEFRWAKEVLARVRARITDRSSKEKDGEGLRFRHRTGTPGARIGPSSASLIGSDSHGSDRFDHGHGLQSEMAGRAGSDAPNRIRLPAASRHR